MGEKKIDRRRMSDEEIARIASAIVKIHAEACPDCSQEGKERHAAHHRTMDGIVDFLNRWTNTRWKVLTAVLIASSSMLTIAFIIWFIYHVTNVDLRKWIK